jgi:spore coat polysaccharide biosynthesis protein SpsF (cytidylyltransferase family)
MPEKTVCIVQARRTSTRLPDKILKPLLGRPALWHTLERCKRIPGVDEVVCAGVDTVFEEPVAAVAVQVGVRSFQGSETNVLERYAKAARRFGADRVIRITSDCPLVDPEICGHLLSHAVDAQAEMAANVGWPHGMDCEIFTMQQLETALSNATTAYDREHVTPGINRRADIRKLFYRPAPDVNYHQHCRWVLDYPQDYELLKALFEQLGEEHMFAGWRTVLQAYDSLGKKRRVNADQVQDWKRLTETAREKAQTSGSAKAPSPAVRIPAETRYWSRTFGCGERVPSLPTVESGAV